MSNDFLPIATSGGAYVETQATFAADSPVLANGFPAGILTKEKLNKVIRQSSIMGSVLAQLIAAKTGTNSVDDGTTATLLANFQRVFQMQNNYADDTGTVNAYIVTLSPAPVLARGMHINFATVNANTTTNPICTVNGTALPLTLPGGGALEVGQIKANAVVETVYNSTGPRLEVQGAATGLVPAGTIIAFSGATAPTGFLTCPTTATNISRTTYSALFAAIGTLWGAGDGSTTFGMPWIPVDYAMIQGGVVGSQSVGVVLAHTHTTSYGGSAGLSTQSGGNQTTFSNGMTTTSQSPVGGAANLPAGGRVLFCVKF